MRRFSAIYLALFAIIILLPPAIHGYVYPNTGDDSAMHLQVIDEVDRGGRSEVNFIYPGQRLMAYSISFLGKVTGIDTDTLFFCFNFLALICIGVSFYLTLGLVNLPARLLTIPIAMFCAHSIHKMFQAGAIFHIISVYIVLLLGVLFMIKYFLESRTYQILLAISLFLVFSIFHPTSMYLPYILLPFLAVSLLHKQIRPWKVGLLLPVIPLNLLLSGHLMPATGSMRSNATLNAVSIAATGDLAIAPIAPIPDLGNFLAFDLGLTTLTILILSIAGWLLHYHKIKVNLGTKLLLTFLLSFALVMALVSFTGISTDPIRTSMDLAIVLALITTCIAGVVLEVDRGKVIGVAVILMVILGCSLTLINWFSYNSAIRPADLEAISWLNSQDGDYFSSSTQVAPWIYSRFLNKEYNPDNPNFVIYRSSPMTDRTNPERFWFQFDKPSQLKDFWNLQLLKTFKDREVEIYIFKGDIQNEP